MFASFITYCPDWGAKGLSSGLRDGLKVQPVSIDCSARASAGGMAAAAAPAMNLSPRSISSSRAP